MDPENTVLEVVKTLELHTGNDIYQLQLLKGASNPNQPYEGRCYHLRENSEGYYDRFTRQDCPSVQGVSEEDAILDALNSLGKSPERNEVHGCDAVYLHLLEAAWAPIRCFTGCLPPPFNRSSANRIRSWSP